MEPRERRRWLSERYALRCRHERVRVDLASLPRYGGIPSEWALRPLGYLRKGKSVGCNCRHSQHGNPKYGIGICCHALRPAVQERIASRRICRDWELEY